MKKFLSLVLALVMALSLTTVAWGAATELPAAQNGVITLTEDVDLSATFTVNVGETITIDLAGHTINAAWADQSAGKHIYVLDNKGTLILKDSVGGGEINTRGIFNYGSLTLESGAINGIDTNGGGAIWNYANATFTMNGGSINVWEDNPSDPAVAGNYDATAVMNEGTAFLNGGTINSTTNYTYAVENHGTLTVDGASIKGRGGIYAYSSGTVTIQSGTIQNDKDNDSTGHAVFVEGGNVVIIDGAFTATNDVNDGNSVVYVEDGATAEIKGGTFTTDEYTKTPYGPANCTIDITGGTFDADVSTYVATGTATAKVNGNSYVVGADNIKAAATVGAKVEMLQGTVTLNNGTTLDNTSGEYTVPQPPVYYPVYVPTVEDTTDTKVDSAQTFDAGVALYVGVSIMGAVGTVALGKKRED